jgi:hypothetical protein
LKETVWYFGKNDKQYEPPVYSYEFFDSELITAFSNNPNLLNLRNDYSIWGERTGVSGANIPIHLRYAIDEKPIMYHGIYTTASDDK